MLSWIRTSLILLLLSGAPCLAQAPAGVDLTLTGSGQQWGTPCSPWTGVSLFPFVAGGTRYDLRVYAAPNTPFLVLIGPPPTSSTIIPGIDNELRIHAPVSVLWTGAVGSLDPTTQCGQGSATARVVMPTGYSGGYDFAVQAVGFSSVTNRLTFSRALWLTYL